MAYWLQAQVSLPEDPGLIPTWWITSICNASSWGSDGILVSPVTSHACYIQTHMQAKGPYKKNK